MALKMITTLSIGHCVVMLIAITNLAALGQLSMPLVEVKSYDASACPIAEQHINILQQIQSDITDILGELY